ncbi:helix-turn-helix transcriptional regulator [Jeotgalibacillus proteolyticus]|uniref:HTH cro/C1-type domain-containing protein n=1 Tax=Jeotgalibacillus proteolyticus TaxID=2082395 RepID=A0A2S5G701_9BACL|nr:helix-turn-helix transcriptional regulator [Jeotgalibacillus proteolyticus]PPA68701.1 hypothetical protein C4B60_19215 [Jeotgalibacillus proteolyticus]PPA68778.1 hypothetical protein C4B60_19645 [Jeotgalibacillus proteolyticus]
MNSVGVKLKQIRKDQNITQGALAEGITNRSYISQIEKGMVKPSIKLLRKLCERLNCEVDALFADQESNVITLDIKNKLSSIENYVIHGEAIDGLKEDIKIVEDNIESLNNLDLALYYFCRGKYEKHYKKNRKDATEYLIKSIDLYKKSSLHQEKIRSVNELVDIYVEHNNLSEAFDYLDTSYKELLIQNVGGIERIKFLTNLGIAHAKIGEYRSSIRFLQSAIDLSDGMKVYVMTGQAHMVLGLCYKRVQEYKLALSSYEKAVHYFKGVSDKLNLANTLTNIGILHRYEKSFDNSQNYFAESQQIYKELNDGFGLLNLIYEMAVTQYYKNNFNKVLLLAKDFNAKLYGGFPPNITIKFNLLQGDAHFSMGETKKGLELYRKAFSSKENTPESQRDIAYYVSQKVGNLPEWNSIVRKYSLEFEFKY